VFWTPPFSPTRAYRCEARSIETNLGLPALVSLSDHDSIEAPLCLPPAHGFPISFEWSLPFHETVFHIGIHNLPRREAAVLFERLIHVARIGGDEVRKVLEALHSEPETLVVLNHPFWPQARCGRETHELRLRELARRFGRWIHAVEMNGLRSWRENRQGLRLAAELEVPVVSGGDRHGCEPASLVNLTNAASFAEFVGEVRSGRSVVLAMPHAREPVIVRQARALWDIMRDHPDHERGWTRWEQRLFLRNGEGGSTPLLQEEGKRGDLVSTRLFLRAVRLAQAGSRWSGVRTWAAEIA
jgi:hypothetical protein